VAPSRMPGGPSRVAARPLVSEAPDAVMPRHNFDADSMRGGTWCRVGLRPWLSTMTRCPGGRVRIASGFQAAGRMPSTRRTGCGTWHVVRSRGGHRIYERTRCGI